MKIGYDPKDAVRHVVHDYVYLVVAGTDTTRGNPHPFNHYAERTFHVHCRALALFFSNASDRRDLYARHLTKSASVRAIPTWDHWHDHIDKHLMHLTVGRTTNKIPWTGEPNKAIFKEFTHVWGEFMAELKDELKPLFASELRKHRADYPKYPI